MPSLARADLESLLRAKRLDHTLTTALPPPADPATSGGVDDTVVAATGLPLFDARLGGGFPRGHLSELVGPRSSGRTSLLLRAFAAATARGELVALVDALDGFDVASALAAGVDLSRLLWIRGHVVSNPGFCHDSNHRALDQALKACTLVLQAGHFGVVAFDVAGAPLPTVRRLPLTTWLRLGRIIEGSQTACVLIGEAPMARSTAGLTVRLESTEIGAHPRPQWPRGNDDPQWPRGDDDPQWPRVNITAEIVRARAQALPPSETTVRVSVVMDPHV